MRRIAIDRERGTPVSSLHFRLENATSPDVPDFHNSAIAQSAHAVANRRSPKRPTANVASSQLGGETEQFKFEDDNMPSLVPSDDEGDGAAAPEQYEKLPDVIMSMDLLDNVWKDGSRLMDDDDRPISRPGVLGTVPKFGLTRVPEVTGDDPESEAD